MAGGIGGEQPAGGPGLSCGARLEDVRGARAAGDLPLERTFGRPVGGFLGQACEMHDAVEFAVVGGRFAQQRGNLAGIAGSGLDHQVAARLQLPGQLIGELCREAGLVGEQDPAAQVEPWHVGGHRVGVGELAMQQVGAGQGIWRELEELVVRETGRLQLSLPERARALVRPPATAFRARPASRLPTENEVDPARRVLSDDDQRTAGDQTVARMVDRKQGLLEGIEIEHDDRQRARGSLRREAAGLFGRGANQLRCDSRRAFLQAADDLFQRRRRCRGKVVVAAVEVEGDARVHGERGRPLADLDDPQPLSFGQIVKPLADQLSQRVANLLFAAGAENLPEKGGQRRLLRAEFGVRGVSGQQARKMHADTSDRMDDLEVVGIVGDQTVPDVLGRRLISRIRNDFPAVGGDCQRLIVDRLRQQMLQERLGRRVAGLAGGDRR